ncbi:MAG TPA: hypothetical protein VFJ06_08645, partial [Halococcus sp.]|nr:hypothetical protein [Halococcus sp.]
MAGNDARTLLRRSLSAFVVVIGILCLAGVVAASNAVVGLNGTRESVSVPQWLYLLTGGAVIGASGLLASIVTDRTFIRAIHTWHRVVPTRDSLRAWVVRGGRLVGLLVLFLSIYLGFTGPQIRTANFTFVLVFAGVRAGLTIVAYLLGNPWPLLNPWRTITESIPVSRILEYPERFG